MNISLKSVYLNLFNFSDDKIEKMKHLSKIGSFRGKLYSSFIDERGVQIDEIYNHTD